MQSVCLPTSHSAILAFKVTSCVASRSHACLCMGKPPAWHVAAVEIYAELLYGGPQVTALLEWLDKGRSYFSVQQFAGLLAAERPGVPCDLKLTMFVGGGPEDSAYAPHVTFVPIPLLSKVSPRPGLALRGCAVCGASCPSTRIH